MQKMLHITSLLHITYQTLSEMTILLLLILSCMRIFFIHGERRDSLAIVPVFSFVLSVLNIFAWGCSPQEVLVFIMAFSVFFWNFRALLRISDNLIIDHYGPLFILISAIHLVILIPLTAAVFQLRPVPVNIHKYKVKKTVEHLYGTMKDGYRSPVQSLENKPDMIGKGIIITTYEPTNGVSKRKILFVPGECTNTSIYEPFFVKLAHDGNTVISADFLSNDSWYKQTAAFSPLLRRSTFLYMSIQKREEYAQWQETDKDAFFEKQYRSLLKTVNPAKEEQVIVVGDGMSTQMYLDLLKTEENIDTCIEMTTFTTYTTPGYGPVEQTDPLVALALGYKRDSSMYMSNHIAGILEDLIASSERKEPLTAGTSAQ